MFAEATIARWVARESERRAPAEVRDIEVALRATMAELSAEGVSTSRELPMASGVRRLDDPSGVGPWHRPRSGA